jgi:hypothetical protein
VTDLDPTCVKPTKIERARAAVLDRAVSTMVLAWACWLITWVAQRMFEDPGALTTLHAVNALALIVGILATAVGLWKWERSRRA